MSDPTKTLALTGALMTALTGAHLCEMLQRLGVDCMLTADGNVWWYESSALIVRGERGWALEHDLSRTVLAVEATAGTLANWCREPVQTHKCVAQARSRNVDEMADFLRERGVQVVVYPDTKSILGRHTRWTLTASGWVITLAPSFTIRDALLLERWSPPVGSF